jgi:hypothetical protein
MNGKTETRQTDAVIGLVILNLTRGIIFARVGLILEFHVPWKITGPVCLGSREEYLRRVDPYTTDYAYH